MTKIFLTAIAVILMIFGLLYLISPQTLMQAAGLQGTASGLSDVRATYGGFQIGFALFLFWSSRDPQRFQSALMATLCIFAAVGVCRLTGIVVDGDGSTFNLIGLAFEAALTLVCLLLLRRRDTPYTEVAHRCA